MDRNNNMIDLHGDFQSLHTDSIFGWHRSRDRLPTIECKYNALYSIILAFARPRTGPFQMERLVTAR